MDTRKKLARLISNVFNPFLVSLVVIMNLSFSVTASFTEAVKWWLVSMGLSVLPVFSLMSLQVHRRKLPGIFVNERRQRHGIYVLAAVLVGIDCLVLYYLRAPPVIIATFVAGLAATAAFMCINLLWKISVHTGFVAASATVLTILYGATGATTAALVPLIAWARIELEHHSLAQVISGALLAVLIALVVFYSSGFVRFWLID